MRSSAFSLVEAVIVIAIISLVSALSITGASRYKDSFEYSSAADQVLFDIKLSQQLAQTSHQNCRIKFEAGANKYKIEKQGITYKTCVAGGKIRFYGKAYFSFVPNGCTDVGGSGTLSIQGPHRTKKIIVSSRGRIRIE